MAKPDRVVKKALLDVRKKKEISVYGIAMKGAELGAKLMPHRVIMDLLSN